MPSLKITSNLNPSQWSSFVYNHPNGNVFQTPEMNEVYKKTKNYEPISFAVIDDNDEILGILLAVIQKEHSGFLGKFSTRSIIMGGPLIKDNNTEVLDFILTEYNKRIKGKAIYTQFRNQWQWNETEKEIFKKHGFEYESHLDIFVDLNKSEDELWKNLKSQARNKIRKAEKMGVDFKEIKSEDEISECYQILEEVYHQAKLPIPDFSLFKNANKALSDKEMIRFFVAVKDEKIIGTRIVFTFNNLLYDWYAGSKRNYYKYNPNDFLPWKIIEWGIENGYKTFDFGGAGKPNVPYGVRDHKMKFGGDLLEFGRFEKVHKPFLMLMGKTGLKFWQKLK